MLLLNILIDYFRSYQMNYSYSVIMTEKNLISEDIVLKGQLANILQLKNDLDEDPRFNVSILELILDRLKKL